MSIVLPKAVFLLLHADSQDTGVYIYCDVWTYCAFWLNTYMLLFRSDIKTQWDLDTLAPVQLFITKAQPNIL